MESRAFFLKYRPQTITELSLVEVRDNLKRIFQTNKIPGAFLFVGNKGSGKTSAARIVAKVVNCTNRKAGEFEPCNHCDACVSITNGSALDLIEIDAASNRGIDDIRSLKEKVRLTPAKFKYKVYIIDEVHMLTTEAFNALLKTLEEPPPHCLFILCTTNPEKVPATIISRCLRFNFRHANPQEMIANLENVAKTEKINVEQGVLEAIGAASEGSFRDGQKILEQLSMGRSKVTLATTLDFLGKNESLSPDKLLELLADKKLEASLQEIQRLADNGTDFQVFLQLLLEKLRLDLLTQIQTNSPQKFNLTELKTLIKMLLPVSAQMKISPIAQLPLEMVIIDWLKEDPKSPTKITTPAQKEPEINIAGCQQIDDLSWKKIIAGVKPLNHSIEALLRATRPLKLEGSTLTIEVFYKFHKDQLENYKRRQLVEGVCQTVLGCPINLHCILSQKAKVDQSKTIEDDIIGVAENIFNSDNH